MYYREEGGWVLSKTDSQRIIEREGGGGWLELHLLTFDRLDGGMGTKQVARGKLPNQSQ